MQYAHRYVSPLGEMLMAADDLGLTGLWFVGQKYHARGLAKVAMEVDIPVFSEACRWLDVYFSGEKPDFFPSLHLCGTAFQQEVWEILLSIPYGKTVTYGEIAAVLAHRRGLPRMSAQAVGGAVGHNPVSIIVPCHRVLGANGELTGYAGGLHRKTALLKLEQII